MTNLRVLTAAILGAPPAAALAQTEGRFFLPDGASNHAEHIDPVMHFVNGVTVFFFVLIIALMLYFAVKYRRRSPHDRAQSQLSHHTALELTWSLPPAIIVIIMFYVGFQGFMQYDRPPADAYEIRVTARTWSWSFHYPNGLQTAHLHIPEGQPVRLVMNSRDVIHSLYVPSFRVKRDVVPGRYTQMWFEAKGTTPGAEEPLPEGEELDNLIRADLTNSIEARRQREAEQAAEEGTEPEQPEQSVEEEVEQTLSEMSDAEKRTRAMHMRMAELVEDGHILYCTEYCGTNHSDMMARVVVHPAGWQPPEPTRPDDPVVWGEQLFAQRGCAGCHQLPGRDPTGVVAPSFVEGVFGQQRQLSDGATVEVDRQYLRDSIRNPAQDVVAGYPNVMPPGLVTDEDELEAIIEYLISLP